MSMWKWTVQYMLDVSSRKRGFPFVLTLASIGVFGGMLGVIECVWLRLIAAIAMLVLLNSVGFLTPIFIHFVRWWMSYPMYYYSHFYMHLTRNRANDGYRCLHGVRLQRNRRYSHEYHHETMDVLEPTDCPVRGNILYLHGGGFVMVHRELMLHSITFLPRNGFRVFAVDYPLSPEVKHPVPVLSVLRSIRWIQKTYGLTSLTILGDSAGGCLATHVVAAIANPGYLDGTPAVSIDSVILLYSICDSLSWMPPFSSSSLVGRVADWITSILLQFSLNQYRTDLAQNVTICEEIEAGNVRNFAPTFLLCGELDPLCHSHDRFVRVMKTHIPHVAVTSLPHFPRMVHGFHGMPRSFVCQHWKKCMIGANNEILKFLKIQPTNVHDDDLCDSIDVPLLIIVCGTVYVIYCIFHFILFHILLS